jgi:hypothetical protein
MVAGVLPCPEAVAWRTGGGAKGDERNVVALEAECVF